MISVIVPVYKVAAYLDRCVESIVGQTYADLEIILVDDGSPDACGEMCDEWARRDGRIRVLHKKNGGLSEARNAGIEAAAGEYIGFVDSDDWIEPDMYRDLLEAIERERAELAVTGIRRTYENGFFRNQYVHDQPRTFEGEQIVREYLRQCSFSTAAWDKLYRRELFAARRFPVGRLFEDSPVIFDMLCDIRRIAVVGKPQYHYFQRADSICGQSFSAGKMDHYAFSREIWERVKREYPQFSEEADVFWGCRLCEVLYSLYESRNRSEFRREERAVRSDMRRVWRKVVRSGDVPKIMRLKTFLAAIHLGGLYVQMKAARVKRASAA